MNVLCIVIGFLLVVVGIVGRLLPSVVTGVSLWSALHVAGLGLMLWVAIRGRHEQAEWVSSRDTGKRVRMIVVLLFLLLTFPLAYGLNRELQLGRQYAAVRPHLTNEDPVTALTLVGFLLPERVECAPLRERIIERIVALDYRNPDVSGPLVDTVRNDPDPAVRSAAAAALGKLMRPRDVLHLVRDLSVFDEETRPLVQKALAAATAVDHGPDAAAWRAWFGRTYAGAEPEEAFGLALLVYRDPGGDEAFRELALERIRTGEGAGRPRLLALAADSDATLRAVAATLLAKAGDAGLAVKLAGVLLREGDEAAAQAQISAIRALDPKQADRLLLSAAETATTDVARVAARAALLGGAEVDPADPSALTVLMYRKATDATEKGRLFSEIVRQAGKGEAACGELVRIVGDSKENSFLRLRALDGAIKAGAMTDDALVGLFEKAPDREFSEALRRELKGRTGKDAKLDAAAWRKILEAAKPKEGE